MKMGVPRDDCRSCSTAQTKSNAQTRSSAGDNAYPSDSSSSGDELERLPPDPLYDKTADECDEQWVQRNLLPEAQSSGDLDTSYRLTCPCCFTLLCLQCQPHEEYVGQFRAVFVQNCVVTENETLRVKIDSSDDDMPADESEMYRPVSCSICDTEVAVLDKDDVYHFCNILF